MTAKKVASKPAPSKRIPGNGERWSLFFNKGEARIRVRAFPSQGEYKVSTILYKPDESAVRSVETFPNLLAAQEHVEQLTNTATKGGWEMKEGVKASNLALFSV